MSLSRLFRPRTDAVFGAIEFTNAKPLVRGLDSVVCARPSDLLKMLDAGEVKVALVPAGDLAFRPDLGYFREQCISSFGEALSVRLYFRPPLAKTTTVFLDPASRSSNLLARMVLAERGVERVDFRTKKMGFDRLPKEGCAFVSIGDACLKSATSPIQGLDFLDLGSEWKNLTGLPFVFAVWTWKNRPSREIEQLLRTSAAKGLSRLDTISREESLRLGLPYEMCYSYLVCNMRYRFGEEEVKGLELFLKKAAKLVV